MHPPPGQHRAPSSLSDEFSFLAATLPRALLGTRISFSVKLDTDAITPKKSVTCPFWWYAALRMAASVTWAQGFCLISYQDHAFHGKEYKLTVIMNWI